jgi:hypothetical protein
MNLLEIIGASIFAILFIILSNDVYLFFILGELYFDKVEQYSVNV